MRTLGTPRYGGASEAGGEGSAVGPSSPELRGAGVIEGAIVGKGRCRQTGTLGFGVGVGIGVGFGLGVGASVGRGSGGTRGSGKWGSPAAESACERFQSGPYGCALAPGEAETTGATDCRFCSVAWPITRLPIRSPIATEINSTAAPAANKMVGNRLDGCTPRYYTRASGRTTSSLAARARRSLGLPMR